MNIKEEWKQKILKSQFNTKLAETMDEETDRFMSILPLKNKLEMYSARSEWDELSAAVDEIWDGESIDDELRSEIAEMAATSCWNLG